MNLNSKNSNPVDFPKAKYHSIIEREDQDHRLTPGYSNQSFGTTQVENFKFLSSKPHNRYFETEEESEYQSRVG